MEIEQIASEIVSRRVANRAAELNEAEAKAIAEFYWQMVSALKAAKPKETSKARGGKINYPNQGTV